MPTKNIRVANDLGYGSVKANIDGNNVKFPSVTALLRAQDIQDPVEFSNDTQKRNYFSNFFEHMDVTINSPEVHTKDRMLVGSAAAKSPLPLNRFDVNDLAGKSEEDLAIILTLSMIAAKRVQEAVESNEDLASTLDTKVVMATALPISEGKRNDASNRYKARYLNGTHQVVFHNFKQPITVNIQFDRVLVALEGETAQFYLNHADDSLKNALKQDFDEHYGSELGITADALIQSRNVLGIDIGEGTTDIVAVVDGKADGLSSKSLELGYGNVLQDAMDELENERINISERSKLQEFLAAPETPLNKQRKEHVAQVVNDQLSPFVDKIVKTTSSVMRKSGVPAELIYVYGGGSIPMSQESDLREQLVSKLKAFSGAYEIPVIWVDEDHAQYMNEKGLELILKAIR